MSRRNLRQKWEDCPGEFPSKAMEAWYALNCKYYEEANTESCLISMGYSVYLPITLIDKRMCTGDGQRTEPLFYGYLFVQMDEGIDDFYPITKTPGVLKIIKMTRREDGYLYPTRIADEAIDVLKGIEDEQGLHLNHKNDYAQGDPVRVTAGPFKDCLAEITSLTKKQRINVLIEVLNRSMEIEVDYMSITPV